MKSIRVPVKFVDGRWEFFYGGSVPANDGAIAYLVINREAIVDRPFLSRLTSQSMHKVFDIGTELLVALTVKTYQKLDGDLRKELVSSNDPDYKIAAEFHSNVHSTNTRFVRIRIDRFNVDISPLDPTVQGGVWLRLEGLQPKNMKCSGVRLPDCVSTEPADSLNHAFTLLSRKYEPWRKTHTGNIYSRVLFKENNSKWYPLDFLRNAAEAREELQFVRERWHIISQQLGLHID